MKRRRSQRACEAHLQKQFQKPTLYNHEHGKLTLQMFKYNYSR